jgi:GH24 family phage-related lysozyme (muramidase)
VSRTPPTSRCLALLRAFDKNNPDMAGAISTAAAAIEANLSPQALADLNEGQFAALIDFVIWKGIDAFLADVLFGWIQNGNLTLPPARLAALGLRGLAERDMWNLGNSE